MPVKGLDHVNIIAKDLDATISFYEQLFGFEVERPDFGGGMRGCWLNDATGRAPIHLMAWNAERHDGLGAEAATGTIDHVALACDDFEGMVQRCEELGLDHRINDRRIGNFRQVFVTDPNNVKLELNFGNG
jgi:catechol 2,3-dioxygenase-like lactoylglutathione lyase family enzyme